MYKKYSAINSNTYTLLSASSSSVSTITMTTKNGKEENEDMVSVVERLSTHVMLAIQNIKANVSSWPKDE
eukprot:Awhi_evm1s12316